MLAACSLLGPSTSKAADTQAIKATTSGPSAYERAAVLMSKWGSVGKLVLLNADGTVAVSVETDGTSWVFGDYIDLQAVDAETSPTYVLTFGSGSSGVVTSTSLADLFAEADLDGEYLRLDASNDPVTGPLEIAVTGTQTALTVEETNVAGNGAISGFSVSDFGVQGSSFNSDGVQGTTYSVTHGGGEFWPTTDGGIGLSAYTPLTGTRLRLWNGTDDEDAVWFLYDGTTVYEGSTDDGFETTILVDDPTADNEIFIPDASGTVAISGTSPISVDGVGDIQLGNVPVANLNSGTGASATTFWRGDGTWGTPAGSGGTVTSVGQTFTGGLVSVTGSPITSAGTLALTVAGTSGGIPYFSSGSTWASSGALTANRIVLGGGAGASPAVLSSLGTTTTVLHGNAGGAPTFGAVSLTADVSGVTPIANGGTNGTATPTAGGVAYGTGTALGWVGAGTTGQVLTSAGSGAPTWETPSGGGGPSTLYSISHFSSTETYPLPAGTLDDDGDFIELSFGVQGVTAFGTALASFDGNTLISLNGGVSASGSLRSTLTRRSNTALEIESSVLAEGAFSSVLLTTITGLDLDGTSYNIVADAADGDAKSFVVKNWPAP